MDVCGKLSDDILYRCFRDRDECSCGANTNVFYLSHGCWGNETSTMRTDEEPHSYKYVIDHIIQDGKIQPLIIVLTAYNNISHSDSDDYSLELNLHLMKCCDTLWMVIFQKND